MTVRAEPAPAVSIRRVPTSWMVSLVVTALVLLVPLIADAYALHVLILVFLFGFVGTAWNLLAGFTGPFSFGHAAYFGIGAYTSTVLFLAFGINPWFGLLASAALGAAAGTLIGFLCFRYKLSGPFFALGTLAFAEMFRVAVINTDALGGARGQLIPVTAGNSLALLQFTDRAPYYYIAFALLVSGVAFTAYVQRTKTGYYLRAIRENEAAADAAGVDVFRYKLIAMAVSSLMTAIGGTFYAQYFLYIEPAIVFGTGMSVDILLRPIVGGAGTVLGPIVGSLLLTPLAETSRALFQDIPGMHVIVFGLVLVVVVLFMPDGIVGRLLSAAQTRPRLAATLRFLGVN